MGHFLPDNTPKTESVPPKSFLLNVPLSKILMWAQTTRILLTAKTFRKERMSVAELLVNLKELQVLDERIFGLKKKACRSPRKA